MHFMQILNWSKPPIVSVGHLKQLASTHQNAISALKALPIPDLADFLLSSLTLRNLDDDSRRRFENRVTDDEFPSLDNVLQFINQQLRILESTAPLSTAKLQSPARSSSASHLPSSPKPVSRHLRSSYSREFSPPRRHVYSIAQSSATITSRRIVCAYCNVNDHSIRQCEAFKALSSHQRRTFVENTSLCRNCLSSFHHFNNCQSTHSCHTCGERHHTILHPRSDSPRARPESPHLRRHLDIPHPYHRDLPLRLRL